MQVQAVSDAGNLVFFVVLVTIAILAACFLYRWLRGGTIRGLGLAIFVCLGAYGAALVGRSLASRTRRIAPGTDKCFDDWCATVTGTRLVTDAKRTSGRKFVAVNFRVSNRAQRAAFRPSQPRVTLVLPDDRVVVPSVAAQREFEQQAGPQEDLSKRVAAGETFETSLVFDIPAETRQASVVLLEGPAIVTRFLLNDENSFFHKKIVFPITME